MTFGVETDVAGAHQQLDRFVAAGGTFVDTADVYGHGRSEEIIGRWFASRPADVTEPVVLATKGRFALDKFPNGAGLSARHLTRALDASLRRLGRDSVDLYQVHAWDPLTPLEETVTTLDGFVRAGKIRYWGLSNFTGWQLTKVVYVARQLNAAGPITLQYQRDQRPTGATRLGDDPNRGLEAYDRKNNDRTWRVIDAVQKVAEDRGVSMAEVALAWVTDQPWVSSTILGARTTEQLEANLRAAGLHLTETELGTLNEASDPQPVDYPYGELGVDQRDRKIAGDA
jgi:aryl-alcohol dehydrogenase-like predicted oxidoreductase